MRMCMKSNTLLGVLALALLTGSACSRQDAEKEAPTEAPEITYPLTGEILVVDREKNRLLVKHDEIPDYMPAMTMEFIASPGDVANAKEGQRIRAVLVPSDNGDFLLRNIWPDDQVTKANVNASADALRQDTLIRGRGAYREVGEKLPDFSLYDQTGEVVQSSRFRGRQIMLNFIFTRCPVATMCPASTMKMMETQRLANEAGVETLELISITLDPEYDTPGVLRDYATSRGIDTSNFSFLTGPERAIKDLLKQFGVIANFDGSILKHTLTTLLISKDGKIIHRADGTLWEPRDFVGKMRRP